MYTNANCTDIVFQEAATAVDHDSKSDNEDDNDNNHEDDNDVQVSMTFKST
jgi:hypothetical protein